MTAEFVVGDEPGAMYSHLLSRLADTLGPATRSALALASILGHRLNDLSMYSLIDLGLGQTMAALGQLLDVRILRDGERGLEFSNELIRAHVYSSIPSPVRKALHASVSDRIQQSDDRHEVLSGLRDYLAYDARRQSARSYSSLTGGFEGRHALGSILRARSGSLSSTLSSLGPGNALDVMARYWLKPYKSRGDGWSHWKSSDPSATITGSERMQEVFALASCARGFLGLAGPKELLEAFPLLENTVRSCRHVLSRVRAARALAHGLTILRDRAWLSVFFRYSIPFPWSN